MQLTAVAIAVLLLTAASATWRSARRLGGWRSPRVWLQPLPPLLLCLACVPPTVPVRDDVLTVRTAGAGRPLAERLGWPAAAVTLDDAVTVDGGPAGRGGDAGAGAGAGADVKASVNANASATVLATTATATTPPAAGEDTGRAGQAGGAERAPDLATALRRHPHARRLVVLGDGLPRRDQATAATLPVDWAPPPEHGLVWLQAPRSVSVGTAWLVEGRAAPPAVRAELHDPSGALVDSAVLRGGRYTMTGTALAAGDVRFSLRLLDARQAIVETATLPITVQPGMPLSAIVRAGAPDPETKYWRRWAADAGIRVQWAADVSTGMAVRDGDARLTPEALAATDLLVVDERAWARLSPGEAGAVEAAVRAGLGLLLRCTAVPPAAVAADWRQRFGWEVRAADENPARRPGPDHSPSESPARSHRPGDAAGDNDNASDSDDEAVFIGRYGKQADADDRVALTAAAVRFDADGAQPLLAADDGRPLAAMRDIGAGRVAVWRLQDSHRLQLAGAGAGHAALWADVLAALARPHPQPAAPRALPDVWVGERTTVCGLRQRDDHAGTVASAATAALDAPDGTRQPLRVDAAGCTTLWPTQAGRYRIADRDATVVFDVRASDDAPGLRRSRDRAATLRLAARGRAAQRDVEPDVVHRSPMPLPRWPFLLAWLPAIGWLMWSERRRLRP